MFKTLGAALLLLCLLPTDCFAEEKEADEVSLFDLFGDLDKSMSLFEGLGKGLLGYEMKMGPLDFKLECEEKIPYDVLILDPVYLKSGEFSTTQTLSD